MGEVKERVRGEGLERKGWRVGKKERVRAGDKKSERVRVGEVKGQRERAKVGEVKGREEGQGWER